MRDNYTTEELADALQVISSVINRCETMQLKFIEGTSQHTLLRNRLKALHISKSLLENEPVVGNYTKDDLMEALRPISSIISKCVNAQMKYDEDSPHHRRFQPMIKAMNISSSLITKVLEKNIEEVCPLCSTE